jgi:hypothetical protein
MKKKTINCRLLIQLCCLLCFGPLTTQSGVNLKNGNFYITYTDHDLKGRNGISIDRTYNSKTTSIGLFGFGWGSEFETRLFTVGDGSIYIREYGGGGVTGFVQTETNELLLTSCINSIVAAAIEKGDIANNPVAINNYKKQMRESEERRRNSWEKYAAAGLVALTPFVENTKWNSRDMGSQQVIKTATGFKRSYSDGSCFLFNNEGLFTGKYDRYNQPVYTLAYNEKKQLSLITDKGGNQYNITTNGAGLITRLQTSQGTSTYLYNGNSLISTTDAGGNIYNHTYDDKYHMTSIGYSDGSFVKIEYYNVTFYVKKITERNGSVTEYVYKNFYDADGKVNDNHYATWVIKANTYTNEPDSNYYEYEVRKKPNGASYTYRILQRVNGIESETTYSENCNNPLVKRRGNSSTFFQYNSNCYLVYKENSSYIAKASYNEQLNKITRTEYIDKSTGDTSINTFEYNSNGDLIKATEGDLWITLSYNKENKIVKMEYEDGVLTYEYNNIGKPSKISISGKGEINVEYDERGEIAKVESPQGSGVSLAVTKAMQALLSRIKPKALDLN